MTTLALTTPAARKALRRWIPQQHGAWAMVVVPALAGALLAGVTVLHAALFTAWLFGYGAAYHLESFVRLRRSSRNPRAAGRHVAPLIWLGAAFAVVSLALAAARPWLLIAAALLAPFFAVNLAYAYRNDERATLNDIAAIVPACAMLLVSYRLGSGGLSTAAWQATLACLLYFVGSVFYVKTMIRERDSRGYHVASAGYHLLALVVATSVQGWLAVPFGLYLARALALPGHRLKVQVVGVIEIVNSALLLAAVLVLLGR